MKDDQTQIRTTLTCQHEPYQGRCIHCDVRFVDGRPAQTNQIAIFPTMGAAHLLEIERALEQAQACLLGDTPEGCTPKEATADTLEKVRSALLNHVPSVRMRLA